MRVGVWLGAVRCSSLQILIIPAVSATQRVAKWRMTLAMCVIRRRRMR